MQLMKHRSLLSLFFLQQWVGRKERTARESIGDLVELASSPLNLDVGPCDPEPYPLEAGIRDLSNGATEETFQRTVVSDHDEGMGGTFKKNLQLLHSILDCQALELHRRVPRLRDVGGARTAGDNGLLPVGLLLDEEVPQPLLARVGIYNGGEVRVEVLDGAGRGNDLPRF